MMTMKIIMMKMMVMVVMIMRMRMMMMMRRRMGIWTRLMRKKIRKYSENKIGYR